MRLALTPIPATRKHDVMNRSKGHIALVYLFGLSGIDDGGSGYGRLIIPAGIDQVLPELACDPGVV
jgi:hypothetical protein